VTLLDPSAWHGKAYSGGWMEPGGGQAPVIEPATGAELGRVGIASPADITQAAQAAAAAQPAPPRPRPPPPAVLGPAAVYPARGDTAQGR
jgi:benzaldehyde dehydrogenase (NAD)